MWRGQWRLCSPCWTSGPDQSSAFRNPFNSHPPTIKRSDSHHISLAVTANPICHDAYDATFTLTFPTKLITGALCPNVPADTTSLMPCSSLMCLLYHAMWFLWLFSHWGSRTRYKASCDKTVLECGDSEQVQQLPARDQQECKLTTLHLIRAKRPNQQFPAEAHCPL